MILNQQQTTPTEGEKMEETAAKEELKKKSSLAHIQYSQSSTLIFSEQKEDRHIEYCI